MNLTTITAGQVLVDGQSWVRVEHRAEGRYTETPAYALDSGCNAGMTTLSSTAGAPARDPALLDYVFMDGSSS